MRKALRASVLSLLALLSVGCPAPKKVKDAPARAKQSESAPQPSAPATSEEDSVEAGRYPGRVHIVEPKDTLLHLAEKYYGDRNQWRKIWLANKKRLNNPNDLPVGMKLIIP